MKNNLETEQQKKIEKEQKKQQAQVAKAWDRFSRTATTATFLKQAINDSYHGGCFQFKTGLKGFDGFIPLRELFKTKGWIVDNYRIINEQLILVIKLPTFAEQTSGQNPTDSI